MFLLHWPIDICYRITNLRLIVSHKGNWVNAMWSHYNTNVWTLYMTNLHYDDVTMSLMASQITSLTIVYPTVYSGVDQREHQSSASLAFVRGIHRGPVNSPHKWPVTRKMFPFDDVIMIWRNIYIDLARNGNSGCANEILGCAKRYFWKQFPWKWKNWGNFRVCN